MASTDYTVRDFARRNNITIDLIFAIFFYVLEHILRFFYGHNMTKIICAIIIL